MIIYSNTNLAFRQDVESNHIADIIEANFIDKIGHRESPAEKTAWRNSMQYMERVLRNSKIKDDCGVLIEYTYLSSSTLLLVEDSAMFCILHFRRKATAE